MTRLIDLVRRARELARYVLPYLWNPTPDNALSVIIVVAPFDDDHTLRQLRDLSEAGLELNEMKRISREMSDSGREIRIPD